MLGKKFTLDWKREQKLLFKENKIFF